MAKTDSKPSPSPKTSQPATESPPKFKDRADVLLNRHAIARRLGVHKSTVVRMQKTGELPSQIKTLPSGSKMWMSRIADVEALILERAPKPRSPGEAAAHAFVMFAAGRSLHEIVVELRQPPDVIRDLYSEWLEDLEDGEARRVKTEAARAAKRLTESQRRQVDAELDKFEQTMGRKRRDA